MRCMRNHILGPKVLKAFLTFRERNHNTHAKKIYFQRRDDNTQQEESIDTSEELQGPKL